MKWTTSLAVLLFSIAGITSSTADEEFDALQAEFDAAREAWYAKFDEARNEDGIVEAAKLPPDPAEAFMPRFKAYAEAHAGTPEAVAALAWMVNEDPSDAMAPAAEASPGRWAVERLARDHAADAAIAAILPRLRYAFYRVGAAPLIALYEKVLKVGEDKEGPCLGYLQPGLHALPGRRRRQRG